MSEWRPIETAPKDGRFLIWEAQRKEVLLVEGWFYEKTGETHLEIYGGDFLVYGDHVTHWQPLPDPPLSPEPNQKLVNLVLGERAEPGEG